MAKKKRKEKTAEAELILECVSYAQHLGAWNEGFKADPDGDYKYGWMTGKHHRKAADKALLRIARMPARTAEGLQAKARIVPIILQDSSYEAFSGRSVLFFHGFAEDVRAFTDPVVQEHWQAKVDDIKKQAAA